MTDPIAERLKHEPVAYRDHSDAWIQCSCGWGYFGANGEEWLEHVRLAQPKQDEAGLRERAEKLYKDEWSEDNYEVMWSGKAMVDFATAFHLSELSSARAIDCSSESLCRADGLTCIELYA